MAFNNIDASVFRYSPWGEMTKNAFQMPANIQALMQAQEALKRSQIENQFMPQEKQGALDKLTQDIRRASIENQYLPESLRLGNALTGAQTENIYRHFPLLAQQTKAAEISNQSLGQRLQAEGMLKEAQARELASLVNNPALYAGTKLKGPAAAAYGLEYAKQNNPEVYQKALEMEQSKNSLVGKLPMNEREEIAATARGAGIDPLEMFAQINKGKTPTQVLAERGTDIKDINKVFATTTAAQTALQKQLQASSGAESLLASMENKTQPAYNDVEKLSRKPLIDSWSKDPEKQIRAAESVADTITIGDLAGALARMRSGNFGIEVRRAETEALLGKLQTSMTGMSPQVQQLSQKIFLERMQKAIDDEVKQVTSYNPQKRQEKGSGLSAQEEYIKRGFVSPEQFNNKEEAVSYFSSLSPEKQKLYKKLFGGKK
jgi:hypothetical protein